MRIGIFHNAFSMFKRETLDKIPFDEDLISKEDRYWANKIIKSEKDILYYPYNIAEHFIPKMVALGEIYEIFKTLISKSLANSIFLERLS